MRLRVDDTERSYRIVVREGRTVSLGRGDDCDVTLTTARASREHAKLQVVDGAVWVIDKISANGTFVNEVRIERVVLHPGDVLRIGDCCIAVDAEVGVPRATSSAAGASATGSASARPAVTDAGLRVPRPETALAPAAEPSRRLQSGRRATRRGAGGRAGGLLAVLLLIVIVTGACLVAIEYREHLPPWARSLVNLALGKAPDAAPAVGEEAGEAIGTATGTSVVTPDPRDTPAYQAWTGLLRELDAGEFGWELVDRLRAYQREFPSEALSQRIPDMVTLFEGLRASTAEKASPELSIRLDAAEDEGRFGVVVAVSQFLEAIAPDASEGERWRLRAEAAEASAAAHFATLEERLETLLEGSRPDRALGVLLQESERYSGTAVYRRKLPEYVERSARHEEASFSSDPTVRRMLDERARAFDECRFADMRSLGYSLLALDPPPGDRAEIAETLVESSHLEQMFREFLDALKDGPVQVSLSDRYKGRVFSVKDGEVEYEVDYKGRPVQRRKRPWSKIEPLKKYALFRGVSHRPGGVLGLVAFAFRVGHEDGAHETLQRLQRAKGTRGLVDAVLARRLGIRLPEGGFVFHEGRFVTPEAKAERLERDKERRRELRLAQKTLRELKRDGKLASFVARAKTLRTSGLFTLAQHILTQLAKRFPKTPPGIEAQRLVDDPLLARQALEENGASENRVDLFFLGEGYPATDEFQESFLVVARRAMNLLCTTEPYKSYRPYFNFFALQLGSEDRGVDREPGGVTKDTVLDGKVAWDVFTVDRAKVHEVLGRMGDAGEDRQAVVLGNDFASVATGGGGVASVCKTVLGALAHEVGHSLGGLRDEYDYWPGNDPQRDGAGQRTGDPVSTASLPPNVMRGSDRDDVLKNASWKKWLDAPLERIWNGAEVGAFEGADHTPYDAWRPQANCKMRTSGVAFCVVCMEQMVKSLYRYARPIDRADPEAGDLDLRPGERLDVRAWLLEPLDHTLKARWFLGRLPDTAPEGRTGVAEPIEEAAHIQAYRVLGGNEGAHEVAWLRWRDASPGRYRLRLEVNDPTPWVLSDEEGLLREERSWRITVHSRVP